MLFLHNIKSSWRNLMKYKVQNAISILCLAVGIVCFAVTVQLLYSNALDFYYSELDASTVRVSFFKQTEPGKINNTNFEGRAQTVRPLSFMQKLLEMELPAAKEILYNEMTIGITTHYEDSTDVLKRFNTNIYYCSPSFFQHNGYKSAITGKPISKLRPGEVVISAHVRDMVYGKGADPRGFRINPKDDHVLTISDVVNTYGKTINFNLGCLYECRTDFSKVKNGTIIDLDVLLNEGFTATQLRDQIQSQLHDFDVCCTEKQFDWQKHGTKCAGYLLFLLLGTGVLLIGLSGFLKMQIQLFNQRSREMAMRRTMGARPYQLTALLCTEVVLVFIITTLTAYGIGAAAIQHILPLIQQMYDTFSFDTDLFFRIMASTILSTLFIALCICVASVYRVLHAPLGMRVGKSGDFKSSRRNAGLCIQFVAAILLMCAMLTQYSMLKKQENILIGTFKDNIKLYQRTMVVDYTTWFRAKDLIKELSEKNDIEKVSFAITGEGKTSEPDSLLHIHAKATSAIGGFLYYYAFLHSDEDIFLRTNIKIQPELPDQEILAKKMSAVYVPIDDAERLCKKYGMGKTCPTNHTCRLFKERLYKLIGYATVLPGFIMDYYGAPSYWFVDNEEPTIEMASEGYRFWEMSHFVMPKPGKYAHVENTITEAYYNAFPGEKDPQGGLNLYKRWFSNVRFYQLMCQLGYLLLLVSILCIVASVYSAISLECRNREKEVALRKIHGAHSRDIVRLFFRHYLLLLGVSAAISLAIAMFVLAELRNGFKIIGGIIMAEDLPSLAVYLLEGIVIVAVITLSTIFHRILKVSKTNAAETIKKN